MDESRRTESSATQLSEDAPDFSTADFERSAGQTQSLARFYMTSDLRAATGLTRTHLDFYLREGVIVPTARTESGYLLFDDNELSILQQVIAWRQEGVGVRDVRVRLGRTAGHDSDGAE